MQLEKTVHTAVAKPPDSLEAPTAASIEEAIVAFLEFYGVPQFVGRQFGEMIGDGDGTAKFRRLMKACGFEQNSDGFCTEIVRQLAMSDGRERCGVRINSVDLPHLLLVALLEKLLPGNRFISVRDVSQLEELTHITVSPSERDDLQKVIDTYPVRLSMHTIRQMRVSPSVAYQYLPFVEELDPIGHTNTWIGQFHQGLLEQMYLNRVIFLLNMSCPVYCRFCFRKHKDSRNQANPTLEDVDQAVAHVGRSPGVKEVVITGGDPFLNRANMTRAIDGLSQIPHVQTLRLATRAVAYYPHLFLGRNGELMNYLKTKNLQLQLKEKRMELATHFIHPDEISPDSLEIITELVRNGIAVYVQTPFLKDCNDQGPELARLFGLLRGAGAELHYIYIPCSPIHGNSIYWTPIDKGLKAASYLRAHLSDRIIPRICTATPIGKMDWHSSGWAVEQDPQSDHFIWLRTPYTPEYFKGFAPLSRKLDQLRVNPEGTIDVRYMARIEDEALFLGDRRRSAPPKTPVADSRALKGLQAKALSDQRGRYSVVETGSDLMRRVHATRVELDAAAGDRELSYLAGQSAVTDVVLSAEADAVDELHGITRLVRQLQQISHVNAVRLRSLKLIHAPECYTRAVVACLGGLNRLTVVHPLRLEIETQVLHASEIRAAHRPVIDALRNRGITVYANTPLLAGVNDNPEDVNRIAYELRHCGIEFHHLYVAGLPLQTHWNRLHPLDVADVIDIATRVRRDGSGREVPRYIIQTPLGDVDFGLTSQLMDDGGRMRVRMTPYDLAYFRAMDPGFSWPEGVDEDAQGRPVLTLEGVVTSDGFLVSTPHGDREAPSGA